MALPEEFRRELAGLLGPEGFLTAPEDLRCYSYDLYARGLPEAVALPLDTDQAAAVLRAALAHKVPVTPRGAGTSLTGGPVPLRGGVVLGSSRMNRILALSPADRTATVQAGVVTGRLQKEVARHGLFYPPNPTSADYCTMGGNVATNAGGASGCKYGVTRDYILGLTAVLPGGEVLRAGGSCWKNVAGYDVSRLLCGSEGLLGFITEITVRLLPQPEGVRTVLAFYDDLELTARSVAAIISQGLSPSTIELMDDGFLTAVKEAFGVTSPEGTAAALLLEVDGPEALLDDQAQEIATICQAQGAREVRRAADAAERETLWKARKGGTAALVRQAKFMVSLDYSVPVSAMPRAVRLFQELGRRHDLRMVIIGHAGDGNLHPMVIYDPDDPAQAAAFQRFLDEACGEILALGGSLSGEHGIGLEKAAHLPAQLDACGLTIARRIKTAFDPESIMNPGKCEWLDRG